LHTITNVIVSAVRVSGTTVRRVFQRTPSGSSYGVYLEYPLCVYCNVVPVVLHPLLHSLPYPYLLVPCDTIPGSDGHGHGLEGHDRLPIVCFDRLDRLKRSNVIVLIVLEGQTDGHGHRLLDIEDHGLIIYDRLLQLDIGSVVMISFCKLATLPSWSWVRYTLTLQ